MSNFLSCGTLKGRLVPHTLFQFSKWEKLIVQTNELGSWHKFLWQKSGCQFITRMPRNFFLHGTIGTYCTLVGQIRASRCATIKLCPIGQVQKIKFIEA